jgi:hypothetical protein
MVENQNKDQGQSDILFRDIASWFLLFILSISSCLWIFLWLLKNSVIQWIFAGLVFVLATILALWMIQKLIFRYTLISIPPYSVYWKIGLLGGFLFTGVWLSFNIPLISPPLDLNPFIPTLVLKLAYRVSTGIALGLVLLFVSTWLARLFQPRGQTIPKSSLIVSSIKYAIPIAMVWGIYLLAFFPGMMSADSMVQWEQVLTGIFVDHHPAFHTFLIWLLTRIYLSPSVIAIAQIIALAFVAGLWFAFFESLGIRRWVIWLVALVFTVVPVNGTMVNTLWKDIPFSTAVLGLTLIISRVVFTKGTWIASISAQIILGITAALVMLLRHDGLLLGVGTLLFLILAYPNKWKPWLVSCLVCAFLYFGIRGPIYNWVGVEKSSTLKEASLSLYSIAAYAKQGSETELLVSSIELTSPNWSCNIWTKLNTGTRKADLNRSISPAQIMGNLFDRIPNILLYYGRCARSMEWVVWDPNGEVRNASHVEVLVDPNPYGIRADSKIPAMQEWISNWVIKTSHDTSLNWFIWRPAFFLYLNLFLSAVLIIRNRELRFGLLSLPILIQSITFTIILAEPNFRYHYAVYLVSVISIPLFFSPAIIETVDIQRAQINKP